MVRSRKRRISRWLGDEADGVTIVELLIALTIVMVTFAALAATILASFSSIRNSEARSRGVALASELVEEMASIPYERLGLFQDDVASGDFGGEVAVLFLNADQTPLEHTATIDRDGRDYQVRRWVTWFDEDDAEDDIRDIKRIVAIVRWEAGGQTRTIRSETLRAPDPIGDFDLTVEVTGIEEDIDGRAGVDINEPDFRNEQSFTVSALVGDADASVVMRFRDRDDVLRTVVAPDTGGDETVPRDMAVGAPAFPFRHGATTFTVYATGPDGQVASASGNFRFYQPVNVLDPVVRRDGEVADFSFVGGIGAWEVDIDSDGRVCPGVTVAVDVEGMTSGESEEDPADGGGLRLTGPDGTVMMGLLEGQKFGGTFNARFTADPGDEDDYVVGIRADGDEDVFIIDAERLADDVYFEDDNFDVDDSFVVRFVQPVGGCS